MTMKFYAILGLLVISAKAATLWNIGADDGVQDGIGDATLGDAATFNGVAFNVSGVQEIGRDDLPGNPANIGGSGDTRDIDDDYYFAGVYNTVLDGGAYTPVGVVPVNESYYERALTTDNSNMRWHFNLPDTVVEGDNFIFTIDFLNLREEIPGDVSSFELTFWVNGTQIGDMQPHSDAEVSSVQSWNFDLDDLGGVAQVGEGFDHYVEIRSTPTGDARWASLDYVQLEVLEDPNIDVATAVNFGNFPVEGTASTETIVFSNTGLKQDLVITEFTLGGDNPDLFTITNAPVLPITLAPGADTQIDVTLTPSAIEQALSATLTVTSNDTREATQDVSLAARIFVPFNNDGGTLWFVGTDDDRQDGVGDNTFDDPAFFNGTDFFASGVRETTLQDLPGNPANAGGLDNDAARDVDDDYYFAGVYNTVVDGGDYTPVGDVPVSESYYERALTADDPNMRWHFNVPETVDAADTLTFTIDFHNVGGEANPEDVSGYDLTFWVNGTQIGEMQPHLDVALSSAQSWNFDLDDFGGVEQLGEGFDHYVEIRSTPTGSARWASLDFVKLEVSSDPIVEDDPNIAVATSVNFGKLPIGSEAPTETIVFSNAGLTQDLVITDLTLGGNNPDLFSITNAPTLPITIPPGANAQIEVTLTPGAIEQGVSATLTVTSNDTTEVTQNVFLAANIFVPFNDEGTLWFVGTDDGRQDGDGNEFLNDSAFFNGTDFSVSGVQESGENFLPGNPANTGGSGGTRDVDDDYYFAGVYNTVVDGSNYTPAGIVAANERYFDRALTIDDPNMRWHFNVPDTVGPNDAFTFTIDFYGINEENPEDVSGFDLTFFVDGQQIGDMQPHTDDNLDAAQSWDFTLDDLGGEAELGPGFDHYVEVRGQNTGSARWTNLDYVKLDITPGTIRDLIITEIAVNPTNDNVTFSFQAKVGEVYIVERSTSLLPTDQPGGWLEIEDFLEAKSEIQSFTDFGAASGNEKYFYRVRVAEE